MRGVGDDEPDLLLVIVDAFVYTAILGASVAMTFFGREWAIVAFIGVVGAAWGSPRIAARLIGGLRRWLGRA